MNIWPIKLRQHAYADPRPCPPTFAEVVRGTGFWTWTVQSGRRGWVIQVQWGRD